MPLPRAHSSNGKLGRYQKLILRHHGGRVIAEKEILCEQFVGGCHIMTGSGGLPAFALDGANRLLVRGPAVITNGWLLSMQLDRLAAAGLKTVYVSIDASAMSVHEENRGLKGLGERIRLATARMPSLGMTALAQVTMSKLIDDYRTLVPLLRNLGFSAVAFSYPQRARLGSSSLAWSSDSRLVNFKSTELVEAFDAVDDLRSVFPVNNPRASVADMKRHLRGQPERFVCYGGYKSFYMDWNFDMWRCDAWDKRMCSVWEFAEAPLIRDGCTACIADCYRDSSVMLHFAVSLGDAIDRLGEGRVLAALKTLASATSLRYGPSSKTQASFRDLPNSVERSGVNLRHGERFATNVPNVACR
jgi:hypothetical protein